MLIIGTIFQNEKVQLKSEGVGEPSLQAAAETGNEPRCIKFKTRLTYIQYYAPLCMTPCRHIEDTSLSMCGDEEFPVLCAAREQGKVYMV